MMKFRVLPLLGIEAQDELKAYNVWKFPRHGDTDGFWFVLCNNAT